MRFPAPTVVLLGTTAVVLAASLRTFALSSAKVDLDELLAAHCEEREESEIGESPIMSSFDSSLESSFDGLLLEGCRGPHRFREAVWRLSSKLAAPAGAAGDFLHGSLLLEGEADAPGEKTAAYERIEKLFRRAWSQSPETPLLRDRLLVFYMEQIDIEDAASRLVEMIQHDPDSGGLALHLTDGAAGQEESREIVLAAALAKDPRREDLLAALGRTSSPHAFKAACYLGALNRVSFSGLPDPDGEVSLAENWLVSLLEAGLAESALDAFGGLPAGTRTAIVKKSASPLDEAFWLFTSEASPEVLLRSLCVAGSLEQRPPIENVEGTGTVQDRPAPLAADLCSGLVDDPYTARMVGPPADDPFPLIQEIDLFSGVRNGRVSRMVWLRALIEWLEREEYPETTRDWYRMLLAQLEAELQSTPPDLVLDLLPPDVRGDYDQVQLAVRDLRDTVKHRAEEIDRALSAGARAMVRLLTGPPADTPDVAALEISRSLERAWTLTPETTPIAPRSAPDDDPSEEDPAARVEALRSQYHPPGSLWPCQARQTDASVVVTGWDTGGAVVGPHGPRYVLLRSGDAGTTWSPPLDTGLRTITDQRVNCSAPLPPLSEGILPVELTPGVLLKLPLATLERDDDGDGLTNLLEERLMTDPASTDTDGDGLDDAEDPLPLIPLTPADEPSELEALLAELVPVVCDTGPSALLDARMAREAWTRVAEGDRRSLARTCGLVFERAAFRSIMPGKRLLVVTGEESERIRQKFGAFDPISIVTFYMDRGRRQAFLRWRQGWRERTALIVRSKWGWRVEPS